MTDDDTQPDTRSWWDKVVDSFSEPSCIIVANNGHDFAKAVDAYANVCRAHAEMRRARHPPPAQVLHIHHYHNNTIQVIADEPLRPPPRRLLTRQS